MYFKSFPKTLYQLPFDQNRSITDILRHVNFEKEIIGDVRNLRKYNVLEGETPESVSEKLYGTPEYHWLLLLINNMVNPFYDWPLPDRALRKFIKEKYGDIIVFLCDDSNSSIPTNIPIQKNDTVFRTEDLLDSSGKPSFNDLEKGVVLSWNKTLSRLHIRLLSGSALVIFDGDRLGFRKLDGTIYYARAKKVVELPEYAAHHFEVSGSIVDPLSDIYGNPIGSTANNSTVQYWDTHIGLYLGASGDANTTYAVSIHDYEMKINEEKRSIFILDPSRVTPVIQRFRDLILS
jgi:hypothetical protein